MRMIPRTGPRPIFWAVTGAIKHLIRLMCIVDDVALAQVPQQGPLIIACNHISSIEVPLIYSHLVPRPVTGFAKIESWDNPLLGSLFTLWGAIPIHRGEADIGGLKLGLAALAQGKIVAIAPEGTRSRTGLLGSAHPGVITLALHSGAPILPLVYWGGEYLSKNLRRLRRTPFYIRSGKPFHLESHGLPVTRPVRQAMLEEVMYQLASLLPSSYRGLYSDLDRLSTQYLRFLE